MITRMITVLAVLIALIAVTGCSSPDEPAQAPQPREKAEKTKAEMIVGKWKLVKRTPANPGGPEMTFEYTKDGKVTLWVDEQVRESRVSTGTYRIEGDTLFRTFIGAGNTLERNTTIDSITEDKLVTSGSRTGELQIHEYERLREKKE